MTIFLLDGRMLLASLDQWINTTAVPGPGASSHQTLSEQSASSWRTDRTQSFYGVGESRDQHWSILRANRRIAERTILMGTQRNPGYWIKKKANRKTGYPVGTIAYYGPDNIFASKVVVGIVISENNDATELRKWFGETVDVRLDQTINEQILEFIEQRNVQRVAMIDQIIGCPHEEGIDYPDGERCPQCPYWANRDRWTGQLTS